MIKNIIIALLIISVVFAVPGIPVKQIYGTTTPGSVVEITDSTGTVIASTTADSNGEYIIPVSDVNPEESLKISSNDKTETISSTGDAEVVFETNTEKITTTSSSPSHNSGGSGGGGGGSSSLPTTQPTQTVKTSTVTEPVVSTNTNTQPTRSLVEKRETVTTPVEQKPSNAENILKKSFIFLGWFVLFAVVIGLIFMGYRAIPRDPYKKARKAIQNAKTMGYTDKQIMKEFTKVGWDSKLVKKLLGQH